MFESVDSVFVFPAEDRESVAVYPVHAVSKTMYSTSGRESPMVRRSFVETTPLWRAGDPERSSRL